MIVYEYETTEGVFTIERLDEREFRVSTEKITVGKYTAKGSIVVTDYGHVMRTNIIRTDVDEETLKEWDSEWRSRSSRQQLPPPTLRKRFMEIVKEALNVEPKSEKERWKIAAIERAITRQENALKYERGNAEHYIKHAEGVLEAAKKAAIERTAPLEQTLSAWKEQLSKQQALVDTLFEEEEK